jgi:uridine phosphorylase
MLSTSAMNVTRRDFLRVGAIGGLTLAETLRLQEACRAEGAKRDINCIFIFVLGGMSHHDLWDLKPEAPSEIRGDFSPIETSAPGVQIGELLPKTARVMDQLAILRGMTHGDSDHGRGFHVMMTGKVPGSGDFNGRQNNNQHPCLGSMVARLGTMGQSLPPYISVPNFLNSGGPAFLGPSYGPFVIEADPAEPEFAVRDITLPHEIDGSRSTRRQSALREINRFEERVQAISKNVKSLDAFYERAYNLMTSAAAKEAFDIQRESDTTRRDYGMTSLGQCCLLARRLVEAGCRFVSIENGHWDTHRKNTWSLRELLVPSFDQALPALLGDLSQRGLLDSTLVVVTTEFGRTPRINQMAGRDHWPSAFSILMAGAGIQGGRVVGATDKQGAYVSDRPITPEDMAATVLSRLGIDPGTILHTPLGRPVPLADGGKPVSELL